MGRGVWEDVVNSIDKELLWISSVKIGIAEPKFHGEPISDKVALEIPKQNIHSLITSRALATV
jgi:hypothetical protein